MFDTNEKSVTIRDIQIPFWRLVMIMVKLAFASIPAAIIVWCTMIALTLIAWVVIGGMAAGLFGLAGMVGKTATPEATASPSPTVRATVRSTPKPTPTPEESPEPTPQ